MRLMSLMAFHSSRRLSFAVWLGLLGQLLWGTYPVVGKRAILEVPKFSLLLFATMGSASVGWWLARREEGFSAAQMLQWFRQEKTLWALALFVVLRSVSNLLAFDLTKATWVQLVYLLTPFTVAIFGALLFKEPTPPYTYQALVVSSVGAALVIVKDWRHVWSSFAADDLVGLGLALLSMLSLAVYFLLVRRSSKRATGRGMILLPQGLVLVLTYLGLTLATGEHWQAWAHLSTTGWLAACWVVMGVFMLANVLQITALSGANPALITSLMPLRLVSAIGLGWLLLGERLTTPAQWLGAALVLSTVSGYLWLQRSDQGG